MLLLIFAAVGAAACNRSKQSPSAEAGPTESATPEPTASGLGSIGTSGPWPPPEPPPIEAGPAPASDTGATKEAREKAALDLLAGGEPATRLPRDAVDPGATFDPARRDRVAPRLTPAQVRMGSTQVTGKLPPEVVQRIVRQNFGRFRLCYEDGLKRKPDLAGKVEIAFVIDRNGAVEKPVSRGSDLADAKVVECVRRAFLGLSFPQPEQGTVTVRYPIMFSPGK